MLPEIFTSAQLPPRAKLRWLERLLVVLAALGIAAVFGLAAYLVPDPKGYGTHEQLGLPPCVFRGLTGVHCPHCGMTTSFCWFVRGEWKQAFLTNPAGLLLAVTGLCLWPWCVLTGLRGVWLGPREPGRLLLLGFAGWLLLSLILWVPQLF